MQARRKILSTWELELVIIKVDTLNMDSDSSATLQKMGITHQVGNSIFLQDYHMYIILFWKSHVCCLNACIT